MEIQLRKILLFLEALKEEPIFHDVPGNKT